MAFNSIFKAVLFLIDELSRLGASTAKNDLIFALRREAENHQRDVHVLHQHVLNYQKTLEPNSVDYAVIDKLKDMLSESDFSLIEPNPQDLFENPLSRRFETEITASLYHQPTKCMMKAVREVSLKILERLEKMPYLRRGEMLHYCNQMNADSFMFGAFPITPTMEEIRALLLKNDTKELAHILAVHFTYGKYIFRDEEFINKSPKKPIAGLKACIAELESGRYKDNEEEFFRSMNGTKIRYIMDELMYQGPLYKACDGGRGRGRFYHNYSTMMGLMTVNQFEYQLDISAYPGPKWCADVQCRRADFESPYVKDMLFNESVYVSGPSGMLTVLIPVMELLCNFQSIAQKQSYLAAVMAYLGQGGLHSMHEVLGPAEFYLGLVPGYKISVPTYDCLAEPPNFNHFFEMMSSVDLEFSSRIDEGWQRFMIFYQNHQVSLLTLAEKTAGKELLQIKQERIKSQKKTILQCILQIQLKNISSVSRRDVRRFCALMEVIILIKCAGDSAVAELDILTETAVLFLKIAEENNELFKEAYRDKIALLKQSKQSDLKEVMEKMCGNMHSIFSDPMSQSGLQRASYMLRKRAPLKEPPKDDRTVSEVDALFNSRRPGRVSIV